MPRAVRRFLLYSTIVLVGLLSAEGIVRLAAALEWLPSPEPLLWHRREVAVKLQQVERLRAASPIDVLFVGSSNAYSGISPTAFDQAHQATTGQTIVSYNAGLAALPIATVDLFVERVFADAAAPKALVVILTPRDMNQNNPVNRDLHTEATASAYGQALLADGWPAGLTRFLLEHSFLFRYRNTLTLALLNGFRSPETLPTVYENPPFDSRGYAAILASMSEHVTGEAHTQELANAVLAMREFDPTEHIAALERMVQFCHARGIRLAMVNMPMHTYMMSGFEHPEADYQRYLDAVQAVSSRYQVPFWDMNASPYREQFGDDDFGDLIHLNDQGAQKASRILAALYAGWVQP